MTNEPIPRPRRPWKALTAGGVGLAVVAVAGVVGVAHTLPAHPADANSARAHVAAVPATSAPTSAPAAADYHVYVTAIGNNLVEFDSQSGKLLNLVNVPREPDGTAVLDSPIGASAMPNGSQVFVADEGKYNVIALDPKTNTAKEIIVGGFPQDVAVSPDGSTAFVTITGPDSGPGGTHQLVVINTSTDKVTSKINVGNSPRRVVFSPDGRHAYVTTEQSVDVVNTSGYGHVTSIPDHSPGGPQDLAISPDGKTVYATNPVAGTLTEINTATDRVKAVIPAGDEPYAVAVSPDNKTVYVTDMNSNSVRVIDAATNRKNTDIAVDGTPGSLTFTPDGSELWVGSILTGNIDSIDPTTNTIDRKITSGLPAQETIDAAPMAFAFIKQS